MKKLYKQIIKNYAAFRAALVSAYKPLYKLLYIKELSQFMIVRVFFKSIRLLFLTASFGRGICYFIYVVSRIGGFDINMDPSFLITVLSTSIVANIENFFGAIRTFVTKLNAKLLYKLLSNPETIEKAEKVNENIQILPKDQVQEIVNEVDHIERLQKQKAELQRAAELQREAELLPKAESDDSLRKRFGKYLPDYHDPNGNSWWKIAELAVYGVLFISVGYILFAFFNGDLGSLDEIWKNTKNRYDNHTPKFVKEILRKRFF